MDHRELSSVKITKIRGIKGQIFEYRYGKIVFDLEYFAREIFFRITSYCEGVGKICLADPSG